MKRRTFLLAGLGTGGALFLGWALLPPRQRLVGSTLPDTGGTAVALNGWLTIASDDTITVWINGQQVFDHRGDRGFDPNQDRFEADFVAGPNRILVQCGNSTGGWQFAVAVSNPTEYAFLAAPAADAIPEPAAAAMTD